MKKETVKKFNIAALVLVCVLLLSSLFSLFVNVYNYVLILSSANTEMISQISASYIRSIVLGGISILALAAVLVFLIINLITNKSTESDV
ncbi:MAG: hypothetical protein HDP34_05300 [Clostridia bacterium]|nr:hypothetical protein [Clostridia bacterium]